VPPWNAELTSVIQACSNIAQAGLACRSVAHSLGFPHFLLGLRVVSIDHPAQFIISGYPREWRVRYDACGYMAYDPVLACAQVRVRPFSWGELDQGSPRVRDFFEDAAGHGLRHGFTAPVHGPHGDFSLLSLAREAPLPDDAETLNRLYCRAHWFAMHLHERLCGLISHDGEFVVHTPRLSVRERQCLSLAARGGSAAAIGRRLQITERTAVFHLNHATEKLGARSRQHAIALATLLGQLDLGPYPQQMERSQKLVELE
jgi:DNA-binding CsgD family transcriptional regulator